jgi:uncharacterized membrane protein
MAEIASRTKRRAKQLTERGDEPRTRAEKTIEQVTEAILTDPATVRRELTSAVREAAIEVLKPVMRQATASAAKYAVTQGPALVKDRIEGAGGASALVKGAASKGSGVLAAVGGLASKISRKGQSETPSGTGRGRRLPVEEAVDVGVDIETAYDQFTQFEDWPRFMHRVERIEQRDDTTLMWHENIWGIRRSWEAQIIDQVPCVRIQWSGTGGPRTVGVVTFHELSDQLTRIMITLDFQPKGPFEKTASGMRISRRALKSDLMRLKAFLELRDEATGAWGGTIEDGDVVDEQEDQERDEAEEAFASEEDEDEDPLAAEEDEDDDPLAAEEDGSEEPLASVKEHDEAPPKPPRPRVRRRVAASKG